MRELRSALSDLRLNDLAVGLMGAIEQSSPPSDRGLDVTSRATPSYIFGPSVWLRGLINHRRDMALLTSTGHSRSSASQQRYQAMAPCVRPIVLAIRI